MTSDDKTETKTTPAQKKATQKYRESNKDTINEKRKEYYKNKKENDPDFIEQKRAKAREYYHRKKALKLSLIHI